jgi:hypothetical protein
MPHRAFTDSTGRDWDVWSVHPEHGPNVRNGWLVFETKGEKRRLVRFPNDWVEAPVAALEQLLESATRAPATRRLIE